MRRPRGGVHVGEQCQRLGPPTRCQAWLLEREEHVAATHLPKEHLRSFRLPASHRSVSKILLPDVIEK